MFSSLYLLHHCQINSSSKLGFCALAVQTKAWVPPEIFWFHWSGLWLRHRYFSLKPSWQVILVENSCCQQGNLSIFLLQNLQELSSAYRLKRKGQQLTTSALQLPRRTLKTPDDIRLNTGEVLWNAFNQDNRHGREDGLPSTDIPAKSLLTLPLPSLECFLQFQQYEILT